MGNGSGVKHGRNGVLLDPLGTLHPLHQPEHTLQMHNVSYIRSFTTGRWYSKLFNPPITAQFLKDVNMEVHAGETMCVCGSSGE
jgi:ABC-type protease/lipase transport system fused ATPase/permease subunit